MTDLICFFVAGLMTPISIRAPRPDWGSRRSAGRVDLIRGPAPLDFG